MILLFSPVGGWAIPRKDLIKKSPIGKGEFGGEVGGGRRDGGGEERERGREGGREREREREREKQYLFYFPHRGVARRVSR